MIDFSQKGIEKIEAFGYFVEDLKNIFGQGQWNIGFKSTFGYAGKVILVGKYTQVEYWCYSISDDGKVEYNRELQEELVKYKDDSEKIERIIIAYLEENIEKIKLFEKLCRKRMIDEIC